MASPARHAWQGLLPVSNNPQCPTTARRNVALQALLAFLLATAAQSCGLLCPATWCCSACGQCKSCSNGHAPAFLPAPCGLYSSQRMLYRQRDGPSKSNNGADDWCTRCPQLATMCFQLNPLCSGVFTHGPFINDLQVLLVIIVIESIGLVPCSWVHHDAPPSRPCLACCARSHASAPLHPGANGTSL